MKKEFCNCRNTERLGFDGKCLRCGKYPDKTIMSNLEFFNKFIFQLFFFRLAKCQEKKDIKVEVGGKTPYVTSYPQIYQWYSLMIGIIPFTGWNNNYRYIFKKAFFLRITKKIENDDKRLY